MTAHRAPGAAACASQPAAANVVQPATAAFRALVVRVGAMGDVLHALPAVFALRQACPEAYLGWVIEPRWLPLLASVSELRATTTGQDSRMPLVDRCFLADTTLWKQRGLSTAAKIADLRRLSRELRADGFRTCVDMQGSLRSAAIGKAAGAERLIGSANPRERPARLLYTERVETPSIHVVVQGCELLGTAFSIPLTPAPVQLPHDPEAEQWTDALLPEHETAVVLAPTAGWGAKEWPPERFGAVARVLAHAGHRVLVNAASPHDAVALRLVAASEGKAQLVPCSLTQLIALIRRSHLVVAGDTGPLHLAAALGIPVVGLYGPTDPARTGPWINRGISRARVMRDRSSVTDHRRHRTTEAGLLHIEVEDVIDAALELLST